MSDEGAVVVVWLPNDSDLLAQARKEAGGKWPGKSLVFSNPDYFEEPGDLLADTGKRPVVAVVLLEGYAEIEEAARALPDAEVVVMKQVRAQPVVSAPAPEAPPPFVDKDVVLSVSGKHWAVVKSLIQTVDSVPFLEALRREEKARKAPRASVLGALDERIEGIE